jgi:hypothetical protein
MKKIIIDKLEFILLFLIAIIGFTVLTIGIIYANKHGSFRECIDSRTMEECLVILSK